MTRVFFNHRCEHEFRVRLHGFTYTLVCRRCGKRGYVLETR